ncbi:MAG TPA: methyltransferase domain-containing protein, partial [Planctomycetota bacterium]|nr:methyltransferase domain-containing protein [Planctomycetota bacterium]
APLSVLRETRADEQTIHEGALCCGSCLREYPSIDGLPLVVRALRAHLADQWTSVLARDDLHETTESALGDACGGGSALDHMRQHVSNYVFDHYGELDPAETQLEPVPGSISRLLGVLCDAAGELVDGPVLDLGCSVGRTSFDLAQRFSRDVLGVDLHHAKLRIAARVLREERVVYARRRVGLVYDRRAFAARLPGAPRVDFWSADAAALPFTSDTFAAVVALNLLDCARSPLDVLRECGRVLRPGGKLLLACPYDWSSSATPPEAWIGGHSQRGPGSGASEPLLRALLTPGAHPGSLAEFELVHEIDGLDWHVRLHERSSVRYRAHALIARKR